MLSLRANLHGPISKKGPSEKTAVKCNSTELSEVVTPVRLWPEQYSPGETEIQAKVLVKWPSNVLGKLSIANVYILGPT